MRPVLPSWMMSRNERPRLRYFLAMETTRRRLPPGELALGVLVLVVDLADGDDALVKTLRVFEDEIFQTRQLFLADFQVLAGVLHLVELFDALLELEHLGG
jgi:hypothetical protein